VSDDSSGGSPEQEAGECVIVFVDVYAGDANTGMGPRVIVDTDDNPDGHYVLHVDAGCLAVWGEANVGTGDCYYVDQWSLDDGGWNDIDGLSLAPNQSTTRSVSLGRLSEGKHTFQLYLNGAAFGEHKDFDVSS
jgi:hypothetical protein